MTTHMEVDEHGVEETRVVALMRRDKLCLKFGKHKHEHRAHKKDKQSHHQHLRQRGPAEMDVSCHNSDYCPEGKHHCAEGFTTLCRCGPSVSDMFHEEHMREQQMPEYRAMSPEEKHAHYLNARMHWGLPVPDEREQAHERVGGHQ